MEFKPLPQQLDVIRDIRKNFDYSKGVYELLLSGSVGSAKSLTVAHVASTHCLKFNNACFGIGRLALPDLKETLAMRIKQHLFETGIDYRYNQQTANFEFNNGSRIQAVSWADGNLEKLGSHEYSSFAIEELTETKRGEFYDVILQRVGRLPHIPETFLMSATNPDAPSHWAYKKLVMANSERVKVYYSNTFDNPYLPKSYIQGLIERMGEKEAKRKIYGQWIEMHTDVIYYAYSDANRVRGVKYKVDPRYPVICTWDFNIGEGKPLSLVFMQYNREQKAFHIFDEVIVDGQRTKDSLDEAYARGLFSPEYTYSIRGDASGKARDTRSIKSDYQIIENFFANLTFKDQKVRFKMDVPQANPPIRERHNTMNGYIKNADGHVNLFVYDSAPTCDEGLRLSRLKEGGKYLENDSDRFQHCTTAIGYAVVYEHRLNQFSQGPSFATGKF